MAKKPQEGCIVVTGSTGRLGTLVRRVWPRASGTRAVFLCRGPARDGCLAWDGGPPPDGIGPVLAVLALWGVTPGPGRDLSQNAALAERAVALARTLGAPRVFHCSSAAVYPPGGPWNEDDPATPPSDYGRSKRDMERAVAAFDPPPISCCLRLANVVGADSLAPALSGAGPARLDRFADGAGPMRSYIGPAGLVRVVDRLAQRAPGELPDRLNVAAPAPVGMEALLTAAGIAFDWQKAGPGAVPLACMDTARLEALAPGAAGPAGADALVADWRLASGTA